MAVSEPLNLAVSSPALPLFTVGVQRARLHTVWDDAPQGILSLSHMENHLIPELFKIEC
jgi:hypothetical protein